MNKSNIVAIYCRLSAEDRDKLSKEDESRSIQNQKSLLIGYANQQEWEIYQIYSDDDYQGSDRSRPAFNQLLQDAEAGKFGIVLCKSQSRFTRELELVEKILHKDFIEWGIRFVGYADNADTDNKGNKKSRQINGLVNEWYLEDLSDNIKSVLMDHRKKGKHIGAFALYGYQKDPKQKGHLIIDPEAAAIVHEVFELFAGGMGKMNIARLLNSRGVPNPTEYKRQNGLRYSGRQLYGTLWSYSAIASMLENEMYIGKMVQGKYENKTYKSRHSTPVPKEKWIIVEGTHEPIIEKELWDKVKSIRKMRAKPMCNGQKGFHAGKVKCLYCGHALYSSKNRKFRYLKCSYRNMGGESCPGSFIAVRFLERAIINELNKLIAQYFDEESAVDKINNDNSLEHALNKLKKELNDFEKNASVMRKAVQDLYLDKTKGIITEKEFVELKANFDADAKRIKMQADEKQLQIDKLNELISKGRTKRDILLQYENIEHLDINIMDKLIDYVEVGKAENKVHKDDLPPIVIHWKF